MGWVSRKKIRKKAPLFFSHCSSLVGNGPRIIFWNDKCNNDLPLRLVFLLLFENAKSKNAMIRIFWRMDIGIFTLRDFLGLRKSFILVILLFSWEI